MPACKIGWTQCAEVGMDAVVVFSSTMAQYAATDGEGPPGAGGLCGRGLGQVDRLRPRAPLAAVLALSPRGAKLLASTRHCRARCSFFVTDNEVELFPRLTPGGWPVRPVQWR